MAKRSGRDRDRDAARKGSGDEARGGRSNRKFARELGRLEKQLSQARSAEAKRLRQLDEAAAEVVRLEAELRRLEAEIAGTTTERPAAQTPAPAVHLTAHAAGLEAELARLESAAAPAPAAFPEDVATTDELEAAEVPGGWPEPSIVGEDAPMMDGEVAEPATEPEAFLRTGAPAEGPAEAAEAPAEANEAAEAGSQAAAASPWAEPWAEPPEIEAPDEWPDVIHLGAGSADLETRPHAGAAPSIEPAEDAPGVAEAPWTTGAGLPLRPDRRNGSAATPAADGAPEGSASPETARREAAEGPEPTARSWPQRSRERAGR